MNKKILLTVIVALMMFCSVGAIYASDVNITDDSTESSLETTDVLSTSDSELESATDPSSDISNNLSTNKEENSLTDSVKNQTEITSQTTDVYYKGSYEVTLKDSGNNATLANQNVTFVINNVNYTAVTDNNGVASVNLTLTPGTYTVMSYFAGDSAYEASNITSTLKIVATIKANDVTKYYKGSAVYSATFFNSQGNVLANTYVTITFNGKSYKVKTSSNGVASLSLDAAPGTYKVVATDPVTGYTLTNTVKILSTIKASDTYKVVGDSKKFAAKFYKSNGKVLANKYIKFKINGKTYKVKTNSKGKAKLSLKNLKKGTYKIKCYNKDGLTQTFKVRVYKKVKTTLSTGFYTFYKSETKKIKVKLTNALGYAPTSGKVIKIKINGKTYTKKTNSKGVASFKLPSLKKGVYKIKCKFKGTSNYKASKVSSKVTVLTSSKTKFTLRSTTTFGYGAGTAFQVAVTAGGVPLVKRAVTFNVDGVTYTKNTNSNGIASLPINLNIGNYTIKYSVNKESKIKAKSGSANIEVKERTGTTLTWKSGTSFSDSSQKIKVLLQDINGNAVSGETLQITINSKTYTATTASDGYATFKTSAPVGTYTATVNFAGSNSYLPNSTSNTVTITLSNLIKGVNEKNTITDLTNYLKSSSNCQVGNSKISALVTKLTKGLTSELDKANAIFNYVRDKVSYSFYYNTKYGATGTLTNMKGNCVDHSHLLVAMFRTAGLAARYVHGKCKFTSGNTYGHVWAQVLIGDTWVAADATSSRNSLGSIQNWNTKSFTLNARYYSLPF